MKMTVQEVLDKLQNLEYAMNAMDKLGDEYSVCIDVGNMLGEYRQVILDTKVDL